MRPVLRWVLAGTVVVSAASLWLGEGPSRVVAAVERVARPVSPIVSEPEPRRAAISLPSSLEPATVEPARRDIFAAVEPPPPPAPPPPKPFVGPPLPPPPPSPPPMNWRYFGSMTTPVGEKLVMLARGDRSVLVQPGTQLDDGYVVQAIGTDAVRLTYPSLGSVVDLPLPPPPLASSR